MGHMYQKGPADLVDNNTALKWYLRAEEQKLSIAKAQIYNLANKDVSAAWKILTNDAKNGDNYAEIMMGKYYHLYSRGSLKDYSEAFKWYQIADKEKMYQVDPRTYKLAKFKVPAALEILTNDAKNGAASAQTILGEMYEKGQGVPQDYKKAISWYRLAVRKRYARAEFALGKLYEEGQVIPQDFKKAFNLYRLATEKKYNKAQFKIGDMYYKGQGVSQNYKKALLWYQLASVNYNYLAKNALGEIYAEGKVVPQDFKKAFSLFHSIAKKENALGQLNLGIMYYKGQGIQKDYVLADKWFIVSSLQENQEAKKYIDKVEKLMSPKQKEKAIEMAKEECLRYCEIAFRHKASLIGQQ